MRRLRVRLRSGGAGESGFAALQELTGVSAAGDAMLAVGLAGTLFFSASTAQARGHVALYLLTTLAPFAVVAPFIGPTLDRFRHGRRVALALTLLTRAALAWSLAGELHSGLLYPLALVALVAQRTYGVSRSAVVPRVLPPGLPLVGANSRLNLTIVASGVIAAPIAAGLAALLGYGLVLHVAAIVYLCGVLPALTLPAHVDSPAGEVPAAGLIGDTLLLQRAADPWPTEVPGDDPDAPRRAAPHPGSTRRPGRPGPATATGRGSAAPAGSPAGGSRGARLAGHRLGFGGLPRALRGTSVLRGLGGFLTVFLAFLLRREGLGTLALGGLAAAAAVGSGTGLVLGGRLAGRRVVRPPIPGQRATRRPEALLRVGLLLAAGSCAAAAAAPGLPVELAVALLVTLSASMAKLGLDAIIQRDICDEVRASAFGRSETALQLAFVAGGALGLLPISATLGFALAAAAAAGAIAGELGGRELHQRAAAPLATRADG